MTTHDAVTRLLDARRLQGLLTNRSGRVIAQYSFLNAEGNAYLSHLADVSGETPRRITRGEQSVGPAALSDNGTIVFASKRRGEDGKDADSASLWALPDNGEAYKLADHDGGFSRIEIRGETLVVEFPVHTWAADENDHQEFSTERSEAKVSGILHTGFPVRRWDHDLGPGRQTLAVAKLDEAATDVPEVSDELSTPPGLDLRYLSLPSGRLVDWAVDDEARFALVQLEKPIPGQLEASEIWRVDFDGEPELRRLTKPAADHGFGIEAISPDGTKALVTREQSWTPQSNLAMQLMVIDLETAEVRPVWPAADFWFSAIWVDDETIVAAADDHGRGSVFIGGLDDAEPTRLVGGADQKYAFSGPALRGDTIVATASAIDVAPMPVSIDLESGFISELANPATALDGDGTLTEVETRAEDGTAIRAWLVLPKGEGPHPLVVFAHGGPWGSWNAWTYRWNPAPFAAAGYAVLLPDPAISTGYGQAMIDRGQQQLGGTPFTDIMTLTETAGQRADIDADRIALAGGSYGGYMANWVAGHTGATFRCIVTHASLWNTTSMGRTTDNASWDTAMREQSAQYSPHHFADQIEVPMLVIHGDKDYRVPIGQGQELWLDLLTQAKTPLDADGDTQHRFLYFPDEGHWILGRGNAEVWYRTVLAFLDTHVLGIDANRVRTLG